MRLGAHVTFLVVLLAGCAAPAAEESPAGLSNETAPIVFVEDYELENATIPKEELQEATLGPEHEHDAWGDAEELVLLDETLTAGLCEGPIDATFYLFLQATAANGAAYGCARISLPEGTVVPEGTGILRVESDATDALKSGSYQFQWRNKAHEVVEEPTSEPVHTWEVALDETDWDIPHATATTFVMYLGSAGGGAGVFDGSVKVRVIAVKAPGWEPIVAVAHVDHWRLPSLHDFPAPGVMRLLDAEASVTNIDPARLTGEEEHGGVPLTDIVAPGAKQLTLVVDTVSTDCAPVLTCWLVPILHVGGYERDRFGTLVHEEGQRRVYVWNVPDEVPEDSVYANVSTTAVEPRIDACTPDGSCGVASIASNTATARIQAFAWEEEADLELLLALAG